MLEEFMKEFIKGNNLGFLNQKNFKYIPKIIIL
jgi:hypothetical protein